MTRIRSNISGITTTFVIPVSSSMLRKTMPFAVPGRWRTMTQPGHAHQPAVGNLREIARRRHAQFVHLRRRRYAIGCRPMVMPVPR